MQSKKGSMAIQIYLDGVDYRQMIHSQPKKAAE